MNKAADRVASAIYRIEESKYRYLEKYDAWKDSVIADCLKNLGNLLRYNDGNFKSQKQKDFFKKHFTINYSIVNTKGSEYYLVEDEYQLGLWSEDTDYIFICDNNGINRCYRIKEVSNESVIIDKIIWIRKDYQLYKELELDVINGGFIK